MTSSHVAHLISPVLFVVWPFMYIYRTMFAHIYFKALFPLLCALGWSCSSNTMQHKQLDSIRLFHIGVKGFSLLILGCTGILVRFCSVCTREKRICSMILTAVPATVPATAPATASTELGWFSAVSLRHRAIQWLASDFCFEPELDTELEVSEGV